MKIATKARWHKGTSLLPGRDKSNPYRTQIALDKTEKALTFQPIEYSNARLPGVPAEAGGWFDSKMPPVDAVTLHHKREAARTAVYLSNPYCLRFVATSDLPY